MRKSAVIAALVVALLPAVAFAQKVNTDRDPKAPFATYKTYMWATGTPAKNPLNETRVHDGVTAKLAAAGFREVTSDPDVAVATHTMSEERSEVTATGYGGWRWGGASVSTHTYTYVVGELVVDIYDARTKQLVWRGTATDTMSDKPEKNQDKLAKALDKMFKEYPNKAK